jgi:hypothetical protein
VHSSSTSSMDAERGGHRWAAFCPKTDDHGVTTHLLPPPVDLECSP